MNTDIESIILRLQELHRQHGNCHVRMADGTAWQAIANIEPVTVPNWASAANPEPQTYVRIAGVCPKNGGMTRYELELLADSLAEDVRNLRKQIETMRASIASVLEGVAK